MTDQPDAASLLWKKSSLSSAEGQCVEFAKTNGHIALRDSKDPDGPVLLFTPGEWKAFLGGVKLGEFEL